MHRKLKLPEADMIIHCGDFSHRGRPLEVFDFLDWYGKLSYKHKIYVYILLPRHAPVSAADLVPIRRSSCQYKAPSHLVTDL